MVTSPFARCSVSAQEGAHVSTNSFACADPVDGAVGLRMYCSSELSYLQGKDLVFIQHLWIHKGGES